VIKRWELPNPKRPAPHHACLRGYTASRFSFNTRGGRCEACAGNGLIKMEMTFLPISYVFCDECNGERYNKATLEVEYRLLVTPLIRELGL
jgi:excinuclease UvrABC ATPase subunit